MKTYTPRQLRQAVLLAVMLTALACLTLLDPSCQTRPGPAEHGPARSLAPR